MGKSPNHAACVRGHENYSALPWCFNNALFFQQKEFIDAEGAGGLAPFTLSEIIQHCIEPTVTDGFQHMSKVGRKIN